MKQLTAIILPLFVLCSCASMTVNVSILDRKFWSSPEQLSDSISQQIAIVSIKRGNGDFNKVREMMKSEVLKAYDSYYKVLVKEGLDTRDREIVARKFVNTVDEAFIAADENFSKAFAKLGDAHKKPPIERLPVLYEAQSYLDKGYQAILSGQKQLSTDLNSVVISASIIRSRPMEAAKQADAKIETAVSGLIGDRGILEDPLASSVVYAPNVYWRKPESSPGLNETYTSGQFGNTDIAVKMEAVGSFTIKGVRLDASKITQATFAVGRQAIKTVAALYGIPTTTGEPKTSTTESGTLFPETPIGFESPERRLKAADEALLSRRIARLTLLEMILIQRNALTSNNVTEDVRAKALKTVKTFFESNRADLDSTTSSKK